MPRKKWSKRVRASFRPHFSLKKYLIPLLVSALGLVVIIFLSRANLAEFIARFMPQAAGNVFYVAPTGSSSGDGSLANPWNLQTALAHPASVKPGDTIYLRSGVHGTGGVSPALKSVLKGSAGNYITVRSYPGEWAKVNGGIDVYGEWIIFRDLEFFNSGWDRTIADSGSNPDGRSATALTVFAPNAKVINNIIHDTSSGIGAWEPALNTEIYGNLIYNVGWEGTDRTHGHEVYTQNYSGWKTIKDNIFMPSLDYYGIHAYGENAVTNNLLLEGNIHANRYFLVKGGKMCHESSQDPVPCECNKDEDGDGIMCNSNQEISHNVTARFNYLWNSAMSFNNIDEKDVGNAPGGQGLVVEGNYLGGMSGTRNPSNNFQVSNIAKHLIQNNTACTPYSYAVYWEKPTLYNQSLLTWNNNRYCNWSGRTSLFLQLLDSGNKSYDLTGWKTLTGFDASSSMVTGSSYTSVSSPAGLKNQVFVRPNTYETKRANIAVYNWENQSKVLVDLKVLESFWANAGLPSLKVGDRYEIRNAQNYFGDPPITGIYSGGPVEFDMDAARWSVAAPIGYPQVGDKTFPYFGAFIFRVLDSTVVPPSSPAPSPSPLPPSPSPRPSPSPSLPPLPSSPSPSSSPTSANLIRNPGFESGTSSWSFHTDGEGSMASSDDDAVGSYAVKLTIHSGSSNIQLYQSGIRLEPNTRYKLSFWAKSRRGHDLSVLIHKHASPYTNYGLDGYRARLTSSWRQYSVEFSTTNSSVVDDARLRFWLAPYASSGDAYYLDEVRLVKL